ncbi:hypothetical protein [Tsukamurella sp. 1534]|uniref:hypothetical protein n=1 Tax=Tsukamurella sp. 1534 TaxID=1151061 RepID=UPI0002FCFC3A|nr:hypothetical protein [Tsukamurella sp. 1534]
MTEQNPPQPAPQNPYPVPPHQYPAQQYSPQQYPPQAPLFHAKFRKHTGLLILALSSDVHVAGSYEDVKRAYRGAQLHNACLGWWGVISLLAYNWIALIGNLSAMSDVKHQARAAGLDV